MRVEISLGLLFPCALKGLPSGRQVRLDSTLSNALERSRLMIQSGALAASVLH